MIFRLVSRSVKQGAHGLFTDISIGERISPCLWWGECQNQYLRLKYMVHLQEGYFLFESGNTRTPALRWAADCFKCNLIWHRLRAGAVEPYTLLLPGDWKEASRRPRWDRCVWELFVDSSEQRQKWELLPTKMWRGGFPFKLEICFSRVLGDNWSTVC